MVSEKNFNRFQNILKEIAPDVSITNLGIIERLKEHPNIFPYLVTRLSPCLYHITILPRLLLDEDQFYLAYNQFTLNKLDTCLVLGDNDAIYLSEEGNNRMDSRPSGGKVIFGQLKPYINNIESEKIDSTFKSRCDDLLEYCKGQKEEGVMLGDLEKGGRNPTKEELEELSNPNPFYDNIPNGLIRCGKCLQYRGICLDPNENFKGKVMTVSCNCDNKNYCAYCNNLLYKFKLSANYYSENDGNIWHVPGFCGLSHKCS